MFDTRRDACRTGGAQLFPMLYVEVNSITFLVCLETSIIFHSDIPLEKCVDVLHVVIIVQVIVLI